jgi:hypothetical protein
MVGETVDLLGVVDRDWPPMQHVRRGIEALDKP